MSDYEIKHGDCRELMRGLAPESVDACVTDPPYGLEFMGKEWDRLDGAVVQDLAERGGFQDGAGGNPFSRSRIVYGLGPKAHQRKAREDELSDPVKAKYLRHSVEYVRGAGAQAWHQEWAAEVLRVLKPGAHIVAFGGTRTFHRLTCALEDAGFEIRDCLMWLYGSGFPKSHDVSKALDKAAGHWRGRAGQKIIEDQPSKGDEYERTDKGEPVTFEAERWKGWGTALKPAWEPIILGRKPMPGTVAQNVQVFGTGALNVDGCRIPAEKQTGWAGGVTKMYKGGFSHEAGEARPVEGRWPANLALDEEAARLLGDASRFFYTAKSASGERHYAGKNLHPTVKPVELMQWLCRLVTPPGGLVLDPFMGSGSTGVAALAEGFRFLGLEQSQEYVDIARRRIAGPLFAAMEAP